MTRPPASRMEVFAKLEPGVYVVRVDDWMVEAAFERLEPLRSEGVRFVVIGKSVELVEAAELRAAVAELVGEAGGRAKIGSESPKLNR